MDTTNKRIPALVPVVREIMQKNATKRLDDLERKIIDLAEQNRELRGELYDLAEKNKLLTEDVIAVYDHVKDLRKRI